MKNCKKDLQNTDQVVKTRDREQMTFNMVFSSVQQVKLSKYGI